MTGRAAASLHLTNARPRRARQVRRLRPGRGAAVRASRTTRGAHPSPPARVAQPLSRPRRERCAVGPRAGAAAGQQGTATPAVTGHPRRWGGRPRGRPGTGRRTPARPGRAPFTVPAPPCASLCAAAPPLRTVIIDSACPAPPGGPPSRSERPPRPGRDENGLCRIMPNRLQSKPFVQHDAAWKRFSRQPKAPAECRPDASETRDGNDYHLTLRERESGAGMRAGPPRRVRTRPARPAHLMPVPRRHHPEAIRRDGAPPPAPSPPAPAQP